MRLFISLVFLSQLIYKLYHDAIARPKTPPLTTTRNNHLSANACNLLRHNLCTPLLISFIICGYYRCRQTSRPPRRQL